MAQPRAHSFFLKMGQARPLFVYFLFFSNDKYSTNTINENSIDGVLGTRTRGGRMVGADESTELWRHPLLGLISDAINTGKCYKRPAIVNTQESRIIFNFTASAARKLLS